MIYVLLKICGILLILYGIRVFMVSSGTRFFIFWILLGSFSFILSELLEKGVFKQLPAWVNHSLLVIAVIAIVVCLCIVILIVKCFGEKAGNHPEYLIVLGAQVKEDGICNSLKYRLEAAEKYLKEHPETKAVLCGGQGSDEPVSEAEAMKEYLTDIEEDRLILEKESTNTRQNLRNSFLLIGDVAVCVVTNNFHLFRAKMLARSVGYSDVSGIAATATPLYLPNNTAREVLAIVKDTIVKVVKKT